MPIDPTLAAGLQPIQIANPDSSGRMNQLAMLMKMQGFQTENQLNQARLQALQDETVSTNALRGLDLSTADGQLQAARMGPTGLTALKTWRDAQTAETQGRAAGEDLFTKKLGNAKQMLQTTPPDQIPQFMAGILHDPDLGPRFTAVMPAENWAAHAIDAASAPEKAQRWMRGFLLTPAEEFKQNQPQSPVGKLQADMARLPPDDPRRAEIQAAITKAMTHAPGTQVNVNTAENQYGKAFSTKVGEADAALHEAARSAPKIAENADRILKLVEDPNLITGTGADIRLAAAKALNLGGANNEEQIKNTELLMSSMASATLAAAKGSALGTSQGFTDKDREFLEKAVAGNIKLDKGTIAELARIQKLVAGGTVDKWNARKKTIPKGALEGTGLDMETIELPAGGRPTLDDIFKP